MPTQIPDVPILLTGAPGFLSDHLLRHLAETTEGPLHLLCLPQTVEAAVCQMDALEQILPGLSGRWTVHAGDITHPRLGLDDATYEDLTKTVGIVWHLAALYDLAVEAQIAFRVNVGGTTNVLDFCQACTDFIRLNYVSTCYVSGERTGTIMEDELDRGQLHKNHYETTKFWAEVEVQRRWLSIPTAIFRPGIVVGDSRTGETNKYDGPYYVFQLLHRLPQWMPFPNIGRGDAMVNLVPVDFATRAMATLGHRIGTEGKVFHIADPHPMTARQIVDSVLDAMGRRGTAGKLPARWVERALENRTVGAWTGVPPEALAYFNHDARYDTTRASRFLADEGIGCPHLSTYLQNLIDFYLRHPDGPPPPGQSAPPYSVEDHSPGTDGAGASRRG